MILPLSLLFVLQSAPGVSLGVVIQPPSGWESIEAPPLKAFAPTGLPRGQVLLLTVWPAERLTGPDAFAAWFARKLAGPGETVLQQSPLDRRPASGLDVLTATQRVTLAQGDQVVRVVYGIAAGERAALAMLTSNQDELVTRFATPVREFFESLRFEEAAPPVTTRPVAPGPAPGAGLTAIPPAGFDGGRPRGLFYRNQAVSGQMETRTLIFLPANRLLRVYPFGGGDRIDPSRCNPNMCGAYRMDAGSLAVQWDNGDGERMSFARSGEGFTLDGDTFQPARGLERAEAVGNWVNPGGISAVLKLGGDGSFEWGTGGREGTLRGRYQLQSLTLVLHFADGTTKPYTLFAAGRSRPAGLISLDGSVYSRR